MDLKRLAFRQLTNRWFLSRGDATQRTVRRFLLEKFERVESAIASQHASREMLQMAEFILSAPRGPLVECGCYAGASSAKLSIVAAMTDRKLYVCDSFEGLPESTTQERSWKTIQGDPTGYQRGQYAATLDTVKQNVADYGNIEACIFVPGYFCNSLPTLDVKPAFVFSDADLISSTRDTLKYLWPRIVAGGRWYTHDANIPELVRGIMDPRWWLEEIRESPPILWGAGYGCGFQAGGIAYAEKQTTSRM